MSPARKNLTIVFASPLILLFQCCPNLLQPAITVLLVWWTGILPSKPAEPFSAHAYGSSVGAPFTRHSPPLPNLRPHFSTLFTNTQNGFPEANFFLANISKPSSPQARLPPIPTMVINECLHRRCITVPRTPTAIFFLISFWYTTILLGAPF